MTIPVIASGAGVALKGATSVIGYKLGSLSSRLFLLGVGTAFTIKAGGEIAGYAQKKEYDKVLRELVETIMASIRSHVDWVARYGGEEFIVLLPGSSAADAFKYAERLREAIASHPFPHRENQPFRFLSISGGIASFPDHERSIQGVIRLADEALYRAKESGRNRILVHNTSLASNQDREAAALVEPSGVILSDPSLQVIQ